jgi:hypothetical protein
MPAPPELAAFMIEMSIDGAPALVLVLSADGAVNRGGSGKAGPVEKDVFIEQTDGTFFREVVTAFDPSWLDKAGIYALPGRVGPRHILKLSLLCIGRPPVVLAFDYRLDSGPPPAIQAFIQRALEVTQPWYDRQRQAVARFDASAQKKPWWKLW